MSDGEDMGATLEREVAGLRATLAAARDALDAAERRHSIDLALIKEDAVDLETARLMTEAAVAGMDTPDVARAVGELRQRKPFLFRRAHAASAMGARVERREDASAGLAREAAETGDRRALLRYLRARRVG